MAGFERTTIIGVGLIGGSLGLALKERGLAGEVVGVGYREATLRRAQELGAIGRWTLDVAEGVRGAGLVVLCTPVGLVAEKAAEALPAMTPGSILTDVASTKAVITRKIEAMLGAVPSRGGVSTFPDIDWGEDPNAVHARGSGSAAAPRGIAFVPAHPMAGSEKRGNESARADLFVGARVILTPTERTPAGAVASVRRMWEGVGALVETLDIGEHDRIVAQISHLPHLVAPAIVNAVDEAALAYAATGMKDTTRIAASDVQLWIDIFKDNRENVLGALKNFDIELQAVWDALLHEDWPALAAFLERARKRRAGMADN